MFDNAGVPPLTVSDWVSPALLVLRLWGGCPRGHIQAGSTTPEAQVGGGQQQPGMVMLVPPWVQDTSEVPRLVTSASYALVGLRWQY